MSIKDLKENGEEVEAVEAGDVGTYIKHPLQKGWALWYFKPDKRMTYDKSQLKIASFSTVEDFWAVYNYIQAASRINSGSDYSLFKEGIPPLWENEANKLGGRWLVNLNKRKRNSELDKFWLETLLCLIGETFDNLNEEIQGAVISIRTKGDKLGIWTRDASKQEENLELGKMLKSKLNIPSEILLEYQTHNDSKNKASSTSKFMYRL